MAEQDPPSHVDESFDWNEVYTGHPDDYEPPNPVILEAAQGLSPGRALDVGCGAGGMLVALAQRGWQVAGIDIASKAIEAARAVLAQHDVQAVLEVADAGAWRPQGEYDLITNSFALPFGVGPRARVFAMFRRAVAAGGTVVLQDFDASMARGGFLEGTDLVTVDELCQAFDGFEILRAEVIETPRHDHGHDSSEPAADEAPWTAAIFHARRPA